VSAAPFITEPIADDDPTRGFCCGVPALDDFFARHALPNDRRGLGKTFVLRAQSGEPAILGFYTLSMADLEIADLPDRVKRGLPQYPVPVARIGRLATDERVRGTGHGEDLLYDALGRIDAAADSIGCFGVLVDAKGERAAAFYAKYGFAALDDQHWPRPHVLVDQGPEARPGRPVTG